MKELESALVSGDIDIAIHSLKDVPGHVDDAFALPFFMGRDYPYDAMISDKARSITSLPKGATLGTCSPRRMALVKNIRPDINIVPIRGNIATRLDLVLTKQLDAIILAEAGLRRMNLWNDELCSVLASNIDNDSVDFVPAVGQGVITAQILASRVDLSELLSSSSDKDIENIVRFEREFLKALSADCDSPVGAFVQKLDGHGNDHGNDEVDSRLDRRVGDKYHGKFMYAEHIDSKPKFLSLKLESLDLDLATEIAREIAREIAK